MKGRILPIGGASAGEVLHLQPTQQAGFTICKAKVKGNIISETQQNKYNIDKNVFS